MAERVRIEIGFEGGQIVAELVDPEVADRLERALASGEESAMTLDVEDARYTIALRRVLYVKRFARESRVGFGA